MTTEIKIETLLGTVENNYLLFLKMSSKGNTDVRYRVDNSSGRTLLVVDVETTEPTKLNLFDVEGEFSHSIELERFDGDEWGYELCKLVFFFVKQNLLN